MFAGVLTNGYDWSFMTIVREEEGATWQAYEAQPLTMDHDGPLIVALLAKIVSFAPHHGLGLIPRLPAGRY
jgi:hypothetical protein